VKKKCFLILFGSIFFLLALAVLPLATACGGAAPEKPIELSYADGWPPGLWNSWYQPEFLKAIEKGTDGKVKTTWNGGGALLKGPDVYSGIVAGTADMGEGIFAYTPGRFPMMALLEQPGIPYHNARVAALVATDFLNKYKPAEVNDIKILYLYCTGPGVIASNKPVKTLEDLKGLNLRASGTTAAVVQALGATPQAMPNAETYVALQKGIIDGTLVAPADIKDMNFYGFTKYVTVHPLGSGNAVIFMAMNLDKWSSLPSGIKSDIEKAAKEYQEVSIGVWEKHQGEAFVNLKDIGVQINYLTPEESNRWLEIAKTVAEDYIAKVEAQGLPGREAYNYISERTQFYNEKYPPFGY